MRRAAKNRGNWDFGCIRQFFQTKKFASNAFRVQTGHLRSRVPPQNEDPTANWSAWLADHSPKLLLFARTQTRSEADAEDVLQDAIVEAARKSHGAPPDLPLVYATLRRRAVDLARSTDRRTAREEAASEITEICWFDDRIEQQETARLIDRAMKRMPEKFREVVMLKIWSELTFAQIAETLDIPLNTAASRYRYGLESLRRDTNLKLR